MEAYRGAFSHTGTLSSCMRFGEFLGVCAASRHRHRFALPVSALFSTLFPTNFGVERAEAAPGL